MTTTAAAAAETLLAQRPLRERKRARLRLTLLGALQERVETTPYAEISARSLAVSAEVSEPTFFAHFPSKTDLLVYHIAVWRLRTTLIASAHDPGPQFLHAFFQETADVIRSGPRMWFEITAEIARGYGLHTDIALSPSERLIACQDPRALELDTPTQAELFASHLQHVVKPEELEPAVLELLAGFYGVPLALGPQRLAELPLAYRSLVDRCTARRDQDA